MSHRVCVVLLLVAVLRAPPANAQDVVEELFLGETASTQDALEFQVTFSAQGQAVPSCCDPQLELELELGLTDRLELSLETGLELGPRLEAVRTAGVAVGAKYDLLGDNPFALVSAGARLGVDIDPAPSAVPTLTGEPFVVAHSALGMLHFNLQAGAQIERSLESESRPAPRFKAAMATFTHLGRWSPVLEVSLEIGDEGPEGTVASGAFWHPDEDVEIAGIVALRVNSSSWAVGLMASLTWEHAFGARDGE
jgi:hypothetical protein